jgi:hypothetical protein
MISCKKDGGSLPQNNLTIKTAQIHKVKPKKKIKWFKFGSRKINFKKFVSKP